MPHIVIFAASANDSIFTIVCYTFYTMFFHETSFQLCPYIYSTIAKYLVQKNQHCFSLMLLLSVFVR